MYIHGLGIAVPPRAYTQEECWGALVESTPFAQLADRSRAVLKKVLCGASGIATRHLALDSLGEAFDLTPDVLHRRFALHAPRLAGEAARRALTAAGCLPEDIDALLISTCTGYLCPGLTSYVSEGLGLRPSVLALDLVGQGCGAAMPNLRTAKSLLVSGQARRVLSVCVEVCSAAIYLDDDPGVLVSACLFGDGAGAAVLGGGPAGQRRVRWMTGASALSTDHRNALRFEQRGGMLRNILSPAVPRIAADRAENLLASTLVEAGVERDHVRAWILHTGGRDVLAAMREKLSLRETEVCHSAAILEQYGNLSSPSVLFVLQRALENGVPDGLWWMCSFGAGFSCHGAILEVSTG